MFKSLRYIFVCIALSVASTAVAVDEIDSVFEYVDSVETVVVEKIETRVDSIIAGIENEANKKSSTRWIKQLIDNGFHINDPEVDYPAFPRFALKVYNWGNDVFNTYDTTYVQGTGKNWKLSFKNLNRANNYAMIFNDRTRLSMMSDLNANVGGYISFMAVSVGYMFNANQFIGKPNTRNEFNFNFTCARFSGDILKSSVKGNARILRFGEYKNGALIDVPFDNISNNTLTAKVFYFFNHNRYSHAAAYCFSKYQLKSAGTWIAGLSTTTQEIEMDFAGLPPEMLAFLPKLSSQYNFHYRDYYLLGGYAHNWVLAPRQWLLNLTVMPAVGYKHSYEDSTDGRRSLFGANLSGLASMVYNHRQMFVSVQGRFDLYLYTTRNFTFLNTYESILATVGVRF
ncbi:MAG: DUF4421 domain-containing protein [Muribaculaceae bacterium]|nr:DUF4421 domain-containing protein [Muribaculaceae bacterium]